MKKFNLFKLYDLPIQALYKEILETFSLEKEVLESLSLFLTSIAKITEWMLVGRFLPQTSTKVKAPSGNRDFLKFKGLLPEKVKVPEFDALSVIKFYKSLELFVMNRSWLYKPEDLHLGKFTATAILIFDNLPTLLSNVDKLEFAAREKVLNLLFSAIYVYRNFIVKSRPDVSTITQEYDGVPMESLYSGKFALAIITNWLKGLFENTDFLRTDIRLIMYSGNASSPNGGASTSNLYNDVAAVARDAKLWSAILKLAAHFINGQELIKLISAMKENTNFTGEYKHSRLFHFTAPGGKARIIANVDWVTQSVLSAIHFLLFKLLKYIPADFTFGHAKAVPWVMNHPRVEGYGYYSVDLSAATDRMPRLLQARILSALMSMLGFDGETISSLWLTIVDREFSTSLALNKENPIRYAVGQGMGMFTSWPIMAIMHHYIVNSIVGIPFERYCLVGDDLLFYGSPEEFQKYIAIMTDIGTGVNTTKTVVSLDQDNPTLEFAKNFVVTGVKIKPIPFGPLFAWNDGVINLETLSWYLGKALGVKTTFVLLPKLTTVSSTEWYTLAYYFFKSIGTDFNSIISAYGSVTRTPDWFTLENLEKIVEIVKDEPAPQSVVFVDAQFTASLVAQCTVRLVEEIEKNRMIAESIQLLAIVDKSLFDTSEAIARRLTETNLVRYDSSLEGGPLISTRERTLLSLIDNESQPRVDKA